MSAVAVAAVGIALVLLCESLADLAGVGSAYEQEQPEATASPTASP